MRRATFKRSLGLFEERKFFGMIIPKEYGGLGFSALANSEVVAKLSTRSGPLAITVMVPNSLGPAELLAHYGTQAQKKITTYQDWLMVVRFHVSH